MSEAAQNAWEAYKSEHLFSTDYMAPSFMAGFAAGEIHALEQAAEDMGKQLDNFAARGANTRARWAENWLRARAKQLREDSQ